VGLCLGLAKGLAPASAQLARPFPWPANGSIPTEKGQEASAAQPHHQAHLCLPSSGGRQHTWGWKGRDGWAGCIPVFFAELGMGFSDIQAFTEHCFTTAGTKRENRVTAAATCTQVRCQAHLPPGHTRQDLHAAPRQGMAR
jgi:hypothetical protein